MTEYRRQTHRIWVGLAVVPLIVLASLGVTNAIWWHEPAPSWQDKAIVNYEALHGPVTCAQVAGPAYMNRPATPLVTDLEEVRCSSRTSRSLTAATASGRTAGQASRKGNAMPAGGSARSRTSTCTADAQAPTLHQSLPRRWCRVGHRFPQSGEVSPREGIGA